MQYAYYAKPLPAVTLSPHPVPNTYPKSYRYKDWPKNLDLAVSKDVETIDIQAEPLEKVTPLHAAAMGNNVKNIYRLARDRADINAQDIRGQTPAYWAAYFGNLEALMVLSNLGADLNIGDFRGKTPLRAAAKYGHNSVVHFLMSQKVSLDVKDGSGLTPLHVAAFHRHYKVYETLVYQGASRAVKDILNRTPQELLEKKCAEVYHNRILLLRLFTSPNPPKLIWQFERLPTLEKKALAQNN